MTQSLNHFLTNIEQYNKILQERNVKSTQIQKIYSTPHLVSLSLRFPGMTMYFYIGRGNHFEGVWISEKNIPGHLRVIDTFLEYLRKHLVQSWITGIEILQGGRILLLQYSTSQSKQNQMIFSWPDRRLNIVHLFNENGQFYIFDNIDFKRTAISESDFLEKINLKKKNNFHPEENEKDVKTDQRNTISTVEEYFSKIEKSLDGQSKKKGKVKNLERKIENINTDLEKEKQWIVLQEKLKNDEIDLRLDKDFVFNGKKINFGRMDTIYKRKEFLFNRCKRSKENIRILQKRQEEAIKNLDELIQSKDVAKINTLKIINPLTPLKKENQTKQNQNTKNNTIEEFKIYKFPTFSVGIGKSAKGNDQLRTKWAKKEDYWFHVEHGAGAHAIVKMHGKTGLDLSIINMVGELLILNQNDQQNEISIIYTEVKNLKGLTGSPGKVLYKKEKHIKVISSEEMRKIISLM